MAKYLRISEYALKYGINERKLRRDVSDNKYPITMKLYNGRETKHIIIDDDDEKKLSDISEISNEISDKPSDVSEQIFEVSDKNIESSDSVSDEVSDNIKDVEIMSDELSDSVGTNLVSMENATFEQLIDKITKLSDDRASTDKSHIVRLEKELFELRSDSKCQIERIEKLIRESALLETECNIKKIELEEKNKTIDNLKEEIIVLKKQMNESRSLWSFFKKDLY